MIDLPFKISLGLVLFSIGLARFNYWGIQRNYVGDVWHSVQFFLLVAIWSSYGVRFNLEEFILATLTVMSLHWIVFDTSLNKFRGLDALYIGHTAFIDNLVRNITYGMSEANKRTMFFVFKVYLFFGSISLWSWYRYTN